MKNIFWLFAIILTVFAVTFQACKKDDDNNLEGKSTINIKMIDAPASYDSVIVEVLSLRLHIDSTWYDFNVIDPGQHDLLTLSNGNSLLLIDDEEVGSGRLTEMRLLLGDSNYVVDAGTSHDLTTPSGHSSGYKIKIQETMEPGNVYEIIIDFDANRSIHKTGNDKYMLKPVVSGHLVSAIGEISGQVDPADAAGYVMAYNSTDTAGTAIDAATGGFVISAIAGEYDVTFTANTGYQDTTLYNVQVQSGSTTDLGTIEF